MSKLSYRTPHTRSRRSSATHWGRNISDIFRDQTLTRSGTSEAKIAPTHAAEDFSEDSQSAPENNGRGPSYPNLPLTYADMAIIAADIKSSFSAAMTAEITLADIEQK